MIDTSNDDEVMALEELCVDLVKDGKPAEACRLFRDEAGGTIRNSAMFVRRACLKSGMERRDIPELLWS